MIKISITLVVIITTLGCESISLQTNGPVEKYVEIFEKALEQGDSVGLLKMIENFLHNEMPYLIGQQLSDAKGLKEENKEYFLNDMSNDFMSRYTTPELIERAGFRYEMFDVVADDGYVTKLIHLINPYVERRDLRRLPVLMEPGGFIDSSAYLIASTIQHHPEVWPRTFQEHPSWNRSLAFLLSNWAFDVWLADTRGSNELNLNYKFTQIFNTLVNKDPKDISFRESIKELTHQFNYWGFSQDDIIANEIKSHMDHVLNATGSPKLSMIAYSFSTPTTLSFLATRPDYAEKVDGLVEIAPILLGQTRQRMFCLFQQFLTYFDPRVTWLLSNMNSPRFNPIREFVLAFSQSNKFRYAFTKPFLSMIFGPSAKYQTLLDLNVLGHIFNPLPFKVTRQMCQGMLYQELRKYDYNLVENLLFHGALSPPAYDLSNLNTKDWIIISGESDTVGLPETQEYLLNTVNPKPIANIVAPGYNHLDMIAGFDNDKNVNFPILNYLIKVSSNSSRSFQEDNSPSATARTFDVKQFLSTFENASSTAKNITKSLPLVNPNQVDLLFATFNRNLDKVLSTFSDLFQNRMDGLVKQVVNGSIDNAVKTIY